MAATVGTGFGALGASGTETGAGVGTGTAACGGNAASARGNNACMSSEVFEFSSPTVSLEVALAAEAAVSSAVEVAAATIFGRPSPTFCFLAGPDSDNSLES